MKTRTFMVLGIMLESRSMNKWLKFFRLPNLPTAPGDALVGAAFLLPFVPDARMQAFAAAGAALFLYLFGLADNDIVGAATDGPERPIPAGEISLRTARLVRALLLLGPLALGILIPLPLSWAASAVLLVATILMYNRTKNLLLMGLCRGLSVICGALAVGCSAAGTDGTGALTCLALGWTFYIAAVTRLSEGEETASAGLGRGRFLLGLTAFIPLGACFFLPSPEQAILPVIGSLFTFWAWTAAVAPLGQPHGPAERRRAVGRTIGALLYLQIGYLLVNTDVLFLATAAVIWLSSRLIRRAAPSITGS